MNNEIKNEYDDLTVYYANELARKYCKFSLEEQKVLHLIFSQIIILIFKNLLINQLFYF